MWETTGTIVDISTCRLASLYDVIIILASQTPKSTQCNVHRCNHYIGVLDFSIELIITLVHLMRWKSLAEGTPINDTQLNVHAYEIVTHYYSAFCKNQYATYMYIHAVSDPILSQIRSRSRLSAVLAVHCSASASF